jgi:hypothetical protein
MDLWVPIYGWEAFQRLARDLGLLYYIDTYFDSHSEQLKAIPPEQFTTTRAALSKMFREHTEAHVFIARKERDLERIVGAGWYPLIVEGHMINKHLMDHSKFGEALGYPVCCRTFFHQRNNWHYDNTYYAAYCNTFTTPKSLSNGTLRQSTYSLAPHMPCSFACVATMSYTAKLLEVITNEAPDYAREINRYLVSPILCLSELRIYRFEGRILSPNILQYETVEPIYPTNDADLLYKLLASGNTFEIDRNIIKVYRNNCLVDSYVARADRYGPELPFLIQCS